MTERSVTDQLYGFVSDLDVSIDFETDEIPDVENIILCGVGGSAVSGDFAADCCFEESRIPIRLVKYPEIPNWAGKSTLVVISSYSGNTMETIEMYHRSREKGCLIAVMTSGGILMKEAEENGDLVLLLPSGLQPRHAIGYMIGYTLTIIRKAGGPDLRERIHGFVPALKEFRDLEAIPEGCLAERIAVSYEGKVPVICSDCNTRSVAFRWKTQVNENSKFVAFCDFIPAFNHFTSDTWLQTVRDNYMPTFLMMSDGDIPEETIEAMAGAKIPFHVVRLGGSSVLENMFRAIILGDYVSIYMAERRGVDPAEVRPVMQMKEKLASFRQRFR